MRTVLFESEAILQSSVDCVDVLRSFVRDSGRFVFVDMGCGDGEWAYTLGEWGHWVYAQDVWAQAVEATNERCGAGVSRVADPRDFPCDVCDGIFLRHCLLQRLSWTTDEMNEWLQEAYHRVSLRKGYVVIEFLNPSLRLPHSYTATGITSWGEEYVVVEAFFPRENGMYRTLTACQIGKNANTSVTDAREWGLVNIESLTQQAHAGGFQSVRQIDRNTGGPFNPATSRYGFLVCSVTPCKPSTKS